LENKKYATSTLTINSMSNDPLSTQVNQEEVHNLLAGLSSGPLKNEKTFDLKEEESEKLKEILGNASVTDTKEQPVDAGEDRIDTPISQPFEPNTESLSEFLAWTFKSETIPNVSVNDLDKNLFFKALLNETDFTLDIEFELIEKIVVTVRGLNAFEQKIIASALKLDTEAKEIEGMSGFASYMQQYCMMYQIITVGDKPFNRIETDKLSSFTLKEHVDYLRKAMRETVDKLHSQKLTLLIKALIIFEIKQKLLHDGLVNRNFWKPQDTV
jgi:hypothetical protein